MFTLSFQLMKQVVLFSVMNIARINITCHKIILITSQFILLCATQDLLCNFLIPGSSSEWDLPRCVLLLHHSMSSADLYSECCVLCASCRSGWADGAPAKPSQAGWAGSALWYCNLRGPHARGRGHKFNSLVCWSHRNPGFPFVCVSVCVWVSVDLGSNKRKWF